MLSMLTFSLARIIIQAIQQQLHGRNLTMSLILEVSHGKFLILLQIIVLLELMMSTVSMLIGVMLCSAFPKMVHHLLHLLLRDEASLHADRVARVGRQVEHVAFAEEMFP